MAFTWRYGEWKPKAWILYELTVYILMHHNSVSDRTDDNATYLNHIREMVQQENGVQTVISNESLYLLLHVLLQEYERSIVLHAF